MSEYYSDDGAEGGDWETIEDKRREEEREQKEEDQRRKAEDEEKRRQREKQKQEREEERKWRQEQEKDNGDGFFDMTDDQLREIRQRQVKTDFDLVANILGTDMELIFHSASNVSDANSYKKLADSIMKQWIDQISKTAKEYKKGLEECEQPKMSVNEINKKYREFINNSIEKLTRELIRALVDQFDNAKYKSFVDEFRKPNMINDTTTKYKRDTVICTHDKTDEADIELKAKPKIYREEPRKPADVRSRTKSKGSWK